MEYIQRKLLNLQKEYRKLEAPSMAAGGRECIRVPVSDGVRLYTVVQKPLGEGPFPTILMRSCYPAEEAVYCYHAYEYCIRGFAFVYQFCRGTGESEGEWLPNVHERQDGCDTLQWLAGQPWVECIGYFGCSYLALTGWSVADIVPDKVKTLYLTHYGTDRYFSAYGGGCFRQDVLTSWAMENAGTAIDTDFYTSAAWQPQCRVDEDLWGCHLEWYRQWVTHTEPTDAYWQQGFWGELAKIPGRVKVPVYIGEGWYDHHLGSALHTWMQLSEESRAHSTLRIGGWNHDFEPCIDGKRTEHIENSDVAAAFSWFTQILKKKQQPDMKICTYTIGADVWRNPAGYPFTADSVQRFYLSASGGLTEKPDKKQGVREYVYDPANPVRSHGGESLLYSWDEIGSLRQPPENWRPDVLSYVSESFENDTELLGMMKVHLWVASDAEDTAFSVKVMETAADGVSRNIRSGICTLAQGRCPEKAENGCPAEAESCCPEKVENGCPAEAESCCPEKVENGCPTEAESCCPEKTVSYCPGEITEIEIVLWDIAWEMKKGSRLRLDVSSSDFPQYHIHSNYAGVWSEQSSFRCASQKVYCGGLYPSYIELPVLDRD